LKFLNITENCGSNGTKIVGGDKKKMSTHPQRKGCWKINKNYSPFQKEKEVGGKEKNNPAIP
jgi:hypothetical protein